VLRAILWRRSGNIVEATRQAGICGVLIGGVLVLFGVYVLISPNWQATQHYFMGGWSIMVGLFLLDTAAKVVKSARDVRLATVGDAMSAPFALEPALTIARLVDDILPLHRQTTFPVAVEGRLHGILSLEDVKAVPRERWAATRVQGVMRLVEPGFFVEPNTTLDSAQAVMKENGVGALAVVNGSGKLVGFLQSGRIRRRAKEPRS
jgi:CBS domain-containing protein